VKLVYARTGAPIESNPNTDPHGQAMVRYERASDHTEHHHHLACDECGTVMPFSDAGLERAIEVLSRRVPLAVSDHEIVLHGACQDCAA
jgi:Fur family transcriptional regulator, ferric uptake regulator